MQYLLLIYEAEEIWESKTEAEKGRTMAAHRDLNARLTADGITYRGEPLMPVATALTVRRRGAEVDVTDGPFATTKEQLAGFYLIDCESIEQALSYAQDLPESATGSIEVRPVADHSGIPSVE